MPLDAKKDLLELDDPAHAVEEGGADGSVPSGMVATQTTRPTVIPSFDPQRLAEESELRASQPTITNEIELERARLASMSSQVPPRADSFVEIETRGEADLDDLSEDEQIAVLVERLSPMDRVPELVKPATELAGQLEDPKAAYVAGFVDGLLPLETIVEVAGLPQVDTLRILDRMLTQGIATVRARTSRA